MRDWHAWLANYPGTPQGLVARAIKAFDKGECDGVRFDLFNQAEIDEVTERMKIRPDIPFRCTKAVPA